MNKQRLYQIIAGYNLILLFVVIVVLVGIHYLNGATNFEGHELALGLILLLSLTVVVTLRQVKKVLLSINDIHSTHDRVRRAEKMASVSHLAAGTADRIRNPLTTIKGFAYLLQSRIKDTDRSWGYTNIILREVNKIERIINNFLLLSRPGFPLVELVNMNKLIDELLPGVVNRAVLHKVNVSTVYDDKLPAVKVDPAQIKHVIANLTSNSLDAMPNGGKLKIETYGGSSFCSIVITDTGLGIPADNVEKIAEPFYTTKADGVGLGLTVSHQIILNHEGFLDIETREGKGTTFRIDLPIITGMARGHKELA